MSKYNRCDNQHEGLVCNTIKRKEDYQCTGCIRKEEAIERRRRRGDSIILKCSLCGDDVLRPQARKYAVCTPCQQERKRIYWREIRRKKPKITKYRIHNCVECKKEVLRLRITHNVRCPDCAAKKRKKQNKNRYKNYAKYYYPSTWKLNKSKKQ